MKGGGNMVVAWVIFAALAVLITLSCVFIDFIATMITVSMLVSLCMFLLSILNRREKNVTSAIYNGIDALLFLALAVFFISI
jgi:hypothetical protein